MMAKVDVDEMIFLVRRRREGNKHSFYILRLSVSFNKRTKEINKEASNERHSNGKQHSGHVFQ